MVDKIKDGTMFVTAITKELNEMVDAINAGGGGAGGDLSALEARVVALEGDVSALEAKNVNLQSTINDLDGRLQVLEAKP